MSEANYLQVEQRRLVILLPAHDYRCHTGCAAGLMETGYYCANANVQMSLHTIGGFSIIHTARNLLAHRALEHQFTDLLYIDTDIAFSANDVVALMKAAPKYKIVAGFYPTKEENAKIKFNLPQDADGNDIYEIVEDRWLKARAAAAGFMLIRHEVFRDPKLRDAMLTIEDTHTDDIDQYKSFFQFDHDPGIAPDTWRVRGEDIHFGRAAYEAGYPTYVDLTISLGHWGAKEWRVKSPLEEVKQFIAQQGHEITINE